MGCCHASNLDHEFFMSITNGDAKGDGHDNVSINLNSSKKQEETQIFRILSGNHPKSVLPTPTFGKVNSAMPFKFEERFEN